MATSSWSAKQALIFVALVAVAFVVAVTIASSVRAQTRETASDIVAGASPQGQAYKLDSGDKVKVTIYGEDDLSGEYDVDGSGNVRLPLIGQVHAAGLTLRQFEEAVAHDLAQGYLVNPKVNAEVSSYRPFTILGEVNKPGEYPYENGMTVLNAVALGGGYTYRANKDEVYIRRKGAAQEVKLPADESTLVSPGDTVRVDERIF